MPENFTEDKRLKPGAHPSLFDGGKKKVILRPSPAAPQTRECWRSAAAVATVITVMLNSNGYRTYMPNFSFSLIFS